MKKETFEIGHIFRDAALTAAILALSTLLGFLFRHWSLHETNVVVVYIFSVLLISRFTRGYAFGVGASVISLLLFNWFFTEPYFTLKVHDMTYLITFAIMMFTSIFTSALTTKVKKSAEDARERENESNALYQMTNHLTDAQDAHAIAEIIGRTASEALGCPTAFVCFDEQGVPEKTFLQIRKDGNAVRRTLSDSVELQKRMEQLHDPADITERDYLLPIYGNEAILAVLRIPSEVGDAMSQSQRRMLHSIIESAALALERMRSIRQQAQSREEAVQERYRSNLLRAISHDIRTPLSGIMGTSEMLMDTTDRDDPRYNLARDINTDAHWLHDMVENILNLTRLRDGKLSLNKQPEAVEEVIGATLLVMEKRLPQRSVEVQMPEQVLMVPMDARLVSQVLINLLDNAHKHTAPDREISVTVSDLPDAVSITVADRGCGIAEYDLPHIFQMFYTTRGRSPDSKRGVGLGLAICQSIVEAHGGSIRAENRLEGGAAFTFTLPKEEDHEPEKSDRSRCGG